MSLENLWVSGKCINFNFNVRKLRKADDKEIFRGKNLNLLESRDESSDGESR